MVGLVAPDPNTIVAFGKAYCGKNRKGGRVPVMACRRKLQSLRKVVLIDEFRTSKRSECCGAEAEPVHGQPRRMKCSACQLEFDRDTNAAKNMAKCLWQWAVDGSRPPGLERPVGALQFAYMAAEVVEA